MIFGLLEARTLLVLSDLAEARREVEPYEADSGATVFYDANGRVLVPQFPARSNRRFLGLQVDGDPGPFEFAPADPLGAPAFVEAL